jgi:type I restriction enzyme S subunit
MVARAKPKVILPEFLPFLMMSDKFMNRAVDISVGSLSPTINWTTLKLEEFDLPPLDQQRRIAEILWSMDESCETAKTLCDQVNTTRDVFYDDALQNGTKKKPASLRKLGDALTGIVAGKSPKSSSSSADGNSYGVLKVSAVGDGKYCEAENKALLDPKDFNADYEVKPGMILVTRCNALLSGVGRACLVEQTRPGLMLCDKTLQLLPDTKVIERDFLLHGLRREPYRGFVERSANGTEAKNVTQETLRAAPFWIPELNEQQRVVAGLNQFSNALKAARANATQLNALRVALVNTFMA